MLMAFDRVYQIFRMITKVNAKVIEMGSPLCNKVFCRTVKGTEFLKFL